MVFPAKIGTILLSATFHNNFLNILGKKLRINAVRILMSFDYEPKKSPVQNIFLTRFYIVKSRLPDYKPKYNLARTLTDGR
jgi:hypothetical protein